VSSSAALRLRLEQEQPILLQTFATAAINFDALVVVMPDYRLPHGWSHEVSDILFAIPSNYPAGQPDNICARSDLRLASGVLPGNNQGVQTHDGRQWLQFSYHVEPNDWRPHADPVSGSNLTDYLVGALTRFDEAS